MHRGNSHEKKKNSRLSNLFKFIAVIPLVAEDYLLTWLSGVFKKLNGQNSWQHWFELIRMIADECQLEDDGNDDLNENDVNAADDNVDIFEANEINMFGETAYIMYKCYQHMVQSIDELGSEKMTALKEQICSEFPVLRDF